MATRIATFIMITLLLAACNAAPSTPKIEIIDPWARPAAVTAMSAQGGMPGATEVPGGMSSMEGINSAAYMTVKNSGRAPDKLLRVESEVAEKAETHISEMKDGVMSMHPVEGIEIPANGQTELKPGGLHIMLLNLKRDLKEGDRVVLTLVFEKSGPVKVEAVVKNP